MSRATFYIVQETSQQASYIGFLNYVVYLAGHFAKQQARVYLNCHDIKEAEQLAELFWQADEKEFIAHNLVGEGPRYGTKIEIGHQGVKPSWNRQVVINMAKVNTTFANRFTEVVDFVPLDKKAKQIARERYKLYRQMGYQLQTIEIDHPV